MDVTSYLLGKKSSGGGGGGGSADDYFLTTSNLGSNSRTLNRYIKKLPNLDIGNGTTLEYMMNNALGLEKVEGIKALSCTTMSNLFSHCETLIEVKNIKTSASLNNVSSMFSYCYLLESAPLFDTSGVTNMEAMFRNCDELKNIPQYDTSSLTSMYNAFSNSPKLNDNTLDNILKMCINATSYTDTKTLYAIGIRSAYYSKSRIEALPSYDNFIASGWTIGY